jgi:flagellar basal-body rod protein FlgF/flagellar basal-body rod protein FlgG
MYISAEGAQAQSRRLEIVANNLANVDTVGFKRDTPSFQARFAEAIQQGQARAGDKSRSDIGGGVKVIDVQTDYSTGNLQRTGQDYDFAIVGEGFFQVQGPGGEKLLTRAGNFQLDANGTLRAKSGNQPVLDQRGRAVQLDPNLGWSVSNDGVISQEGSNYVLGMMKPATLGDLVKVGTNQFRSLGQVQPVPPAERQMRQGYLEMSGANSTEQMMAMIETSRAFEANTRMVQNHDSMTSSLINRVLQA